MRTHVRRDGGARRRTRCRVLQVWSQYIGTCDHTYLLLQNLFSYCRMCSHTHAVHRDMRTRVLQSVLSYYRMYFLTVECVLLLAQYIGARNQRRASALHVGAVGGLSHQDTGVSSARCILCSLTIECVLLLQNVFSYYRCHMNSILPSPSPSRMLSGMQGDI